MRFLLDANALILLLGGHEPLVNRASECAEGDLCLSSICFAQVLRGSAAGKPPLPEVMERVSTRIAVLPFDVEAAIRYAQLPFKRHRFDLLIAAHTLALDLTLVTANPRDFRDIPDLRIEDWTR